jgi:hypothetical protein
MTRLIAAAVCCLALSAPAFAGTCGEAALQAQLEAIDQNTRMIELRTKALDPGYALPPARDHGDTSAGLKKSCKRGEMVALPRSSVWLVKDICDFNKAIVQSGDTTTCVVR